jgi:Fe-S-cluster-containing hydrogenase component 2
MVKLDEHPTVKRFRARAASGEMPPSPSGDLAAHWLRQLCVDAGADDVGFVEIDRPEIDDQRQDILALFPHARTLISFVVRMNREPIRSPARSAANLEFHHTGDEVNEVARRVVAALEAHGFRALNPAMGFPMEMDRYPGKTWVVAHKPVAVAAGLGQMGIHRSVIHPQFGSFILLGTVLTDAAVSEYQAPLDYNPCLECKLCVAACPVGAIGSDGAFDFSACITHNYREFMGGFTDWVETVADSKDRQEYRRQVAPSESASMWQSLSFGANYKAAYCIAACPAGEDVIGPFLQDRKTFIHEVVEPLQQKEEPVYVVPGSDAEAHVARRFPHKTIRRVKARLRAATVQALFRRGLPVTFQRERSRGLDATYHFTFTGAEPGDWTVVIRDRKLQVQEGLSGTAGVHVTADSGWWLGFLAKERSLLGGLLRRKIRIKGSPRLLAAFGKCFAS